MGALSKLDAVNRILRGAGYSPVNSLETDGVNDATVAEQVLDETNMQVQLPGIHCNTRVTTYTPDANGHIVIPDETLEVDTTGVSAYKNVCQTGKTPTLLYDLDNETDEFEDDLHLRIVVLIDFDELPTGTQFEVADLAAVIFQELTVGDPNLDRSLINLAVQSRVASRAANVRLSDKNLFRSSQTAAQAARRDRNYWTGGWA